MFPSASEKRADQSRATANQALGADQNANVEKPVEPISFDLEPTSHEGQARYPKTMAQRADSMPAASDHSLPTQSKPAPMLASAQAILDTAGSKALTKEEGSKFKTNQQKQSQKKKAEPKNKTKKAAAKSAPARTMSFDQAKIKHYQLIVSDNLAKRLSMGDLAGKAVFQLCGAQFGAGHDVDVHKELIIGFTQATKEAGVKPVFELRQYNVLYQEGAERAKEQFRKNLQEVFDHAELDMTDHDFDIVLKMGRDETRPPDPDFTPDHGEWLTELQTALQQLSNNPDYTEPFKKCPLGISQRTPAEKSPLRSLLMGDFAIPHEAKILALKSDDQLTEIANDRLESKPMRYLAYLQREYSLMASPSSQDVIPPLPAAMPAKRGNSTQPAEVVVFTNFVTGDDHTSKEATLTSATHSYNKSSNNLAAPLIVLAVESRGINYEKKESSPSFSSLFEEEDQGFEFEPITVTSAPQISEVNASRVKKQALESSVIPESLLKKRASSSSDLRGNG